MSMLRLVCKSKIRNAVITQKNLHYSGSIGIDKKLIQACDLYPNEIVQVLNVNNGSRLETYVIEAPAGSGTISLYGPAARCGEIGDEIVILSYGILETKEVPGFKMKIVSVDKKNRIIKK